MVVEECPAEKLIEVEQRYLDEARQNGDSAYNLSFVAGGGEITAEARAKISASLLRHYTEHPETHERLPIPLGKETYSRTQSQCFGIQTRRETPHVR